MKSATPYVKKLKRLAGAVRKRYQPATPPDLPPEEVLILSVLRANNTLEAALAALARFHDEFVDMNEMRVAPARDFAELLHGTPDARDKAERLVAGLNFVFDHVNALDPRRVRDMNKRDQRSYLRDAMKLDSFAEACMMLYLFESPALPVDERLLAKLKAGGEVPPGASADDARALLERVVPAKLRREAFECLARYAADTADQKEKSKSAAKGGRRQGGGAAAKKAGAAKKSDGSPNAKKKAAANSKDN